MQIKVGADPELFVREAGTEKFVSAFNLIKGTKQEPFPVKCGAVQVDGMALEFNIDPVEKRDEWVHNLNTVLGALRDMVPDDFDFALEATAHFDPDYLDRQPHEALNLGCDPDFNAYSGKMNVPPNINLPMRTAAGHIHVGWREGSGDSDMQEACVIVKQMDYILGLPSLLLDADVERRKMYGKAGAFRVKPYGVEYRVLSNFWLKSEKLMEWAFDSTKKAMSLVVDEGRDLYDEYGDTARTLIDTNDVEGARAFVSNELNGLVIEGA